MCLYLVGGELDQVESMWGRTCHGVKLVATMVGEGGGGYKIE